jgi:DNA-binding beta-propeller fold protein YncE
MRSAVLVVTLASGCGITFPTNSQLPPWSTPPWAHQNRFAITNNRSDELSFITADSAMPTLLANMPVGDIPVELEGPHHLAASPDGKYIYYNLSNYVPGSGAGPHGSHGLGLVPGSLVKLDAHTTEKLGEVLVDRSPGDVILSPDGAFAYVTHYDLIRVQQAAVSGGSVESAYSTLAIVDTASMTRLSLTPVCITSHGEGLSADGKTLYVTCAQSDQVAVVDVNDPAHPQVRARVPIGPNPNMTLANNGNYGPYALTVSPLDGKVWISDNNSADVRVFDPQTMAMDPNGVVPVGGVAMFADFSHDGKTLFVPHQGDDQLTAIDTQQKKVIGAPLPMPQGACLNMHMIRLTPDGARAIVICEGDHAVKPGTAVMLSIAPLAVTGFATLAMFPDGAAWLPP